ncbi:basic leucine zipper 43-like [Tripterygium wilfordii]|uniref:Basic leucine zipper 43-like n=1 Tax=Tripterygium wilfordii TaxID=458696 RepID=A0A7J7CNI1_TRIWF|nr:basic leucine zipper 43-like [Tripterygium wilfordii]KAF5735640.1 basic leucine zipper 43-like [Tripterygium wilfordii]
MQPSEVTGLHYLIPSDPSPYSSHFGIITPQNNTTMPSTYQSNRIGNYNINHPLYNNIQEISPQSSGFSSNSTSDEADEQQQSIIINERKQRRMISNRESARRSRVRKQKRLDELWLQVVWLRNENHQLIDKINHVSECHDKAVQENSQLKEEATELREMISDMQLNGPYSAFKDHQDV